MKSKHFFTLLVLQICFGCAVKITNKPFFHPDVYTNIGLIQIDTLTLIDSSRERVIPITIYNKENSIHGKYRYHSEIRKKLVILNPGYGGTRSGYSYIANSLAANGYLVVTVQHDLPADDTLPVKGDIYKLRKPFWDRGVKSILFVTSKLKREYPKLDFDQLILIGHSNGGDIAMLMAKEYPNFAKTIITLDNRRVPFPKTTLPKVFSIRSSDQPADPGVLPSTTEQKKYHIKIVKVNTIHNDMGGTGTEAQRQEINNYILNFLNSR